MIDSCGRNITYLRVSVTELCNLRCRYCMPEEGVCKKQHEDMLTEDETIAVIETAAELGIRKIRITGGEPLVKKNIVSLCARTAAVPGIEEVCITTNGTLLPQFAKPLREAGVRRINLSLDTLDPEKYAWITRVGRVEEALRGLEAALEAGFEKVKVNAVLVGGFNEEDIVPLAELTRTHGVDMRFIELMPMVSGVFGPQAYLSCSAVLEALPDAVEEAPDGGVAKLYRLPGAAGRIGLISPISEHFCARCNRLRLTADGKLKPCLHSGAEFSVKGLDKAGIAAQLERAIGAKPARHGELSAFSQSEAGRSMNRIGG